MPLDARGRGNLALDAAGAVNDASAGGRKHGVDVLGSGLGFIHAKLVANSPLMAR